MLMASALQHVQRGVMILLLLYDGSVRTKWYRIAKCDANWPLLRLKMPHVSHTCVTQKAQVIWQKHTMSRMTVD